MMYASLCQLFIIPFAVCETDCRFKNCCVQPYCDNGKRVGTYKCFFLLKLLCSFTPILPPLYNMLILGNNCGLLLKEQLGLGCQEAPVITSL